MRDGQLIATSETAATTMDEVIGNMLGKSFEEEFPKVELPIGEVILEAAGWLAARCAVRM